MRLIPTLKTKASELSSGEPLAQPKSHSDLVSFSISGFRAPGSSVTCINGSWGEDHGRIVGERGGVGEETQCLVSGLEDASQSRQQGLFKFKTPVNALWD